MTIGLLGVGRIGALVAKRLQAFGTRVLATDPYADAARMRELGVDLVPLGELLAASHGVSLHLPATSETRRIINADTLARMRPGAVLVNTARGSLVDEAALAAALAGKGLAGAALDVFDPEPLCEDSPLRGMDNVLLTPHAGFFSTDSLEALQRMGRRRRARASAGTAAVAHRLASPRRGGPPKGSWNTGVAPDQHHPDPSRTVRAPRRGSGVRRRSEERHDHGIHPPFRHGGRGSSPRQQLQPQGQPGGMADDVVDPGGGLDLYSIAFVLIFIKQQYNPNPLLLGLAAAAPQAGALIGAVLGGWLSDLIGRRVMFLSTMILFVVFALAQAFVPGWGWLIVVRFILGLPLGSDISHSYAYIMETLPKGAREVMGSRWQFMFALGEVLTIAVVVLLNPGEHSQRDSVARDARPGRGAGAGHPAAAPQPPGTAIWLIRSGRYREAKRVSQQMYGDALDMLPDEDVVIAKPRAAAFLADTRRDPVRWRATLYGWIACFCQAAEFSTFAFYLPVLFLSLGVSTVLGNNVVLMGVYTFAAISGWIAPLLLPRIGHRGLGAAGFGIVFVSLLVAAVAFYTRHPAIVPLAAAGMVWGHYWDASNGMTVPTLVARPEYRGIASGSPTCS